MSPELAAICVKAIRNDKIVGRGTCSYIDETYEDSELVEALECEPAATQSAYGAVKWARKVEAALQERERSVRNEIF